MPRAYSRIDVPLALAPYDAPGDEVAEADHAYGSALCAAFAWEYDELGFTPPPKPLDGIRIDDHDGILMSARDRRALLSWWRGNVETAMLEWWHRCQRHRRPRPPRIGPRKP